MVATVRLSGVIGDVGRLRGALSLESLVEPLERAFRLGNVKTVALVVNSPGGSAVQSALIAQRIRDLAALHKVPVVAFVDDVAASGGYWLACAADEIFAQEASIVGSIGVVSSGFGFTEAIEKLGIERRVHTAGERKSFLDPFQPENPADVARLEAILREIHETFIATVRSRRAGRLRGESAELFTGDFWTGRRALDLGLIDGLGEVRSLMRQRFGNKIKIRTVGGRRSLRRLLGGVRLSLGHRSYGDDFGVRLASGVLDALEARALWSRFGL